MRTRKNQTKLYRLKKGVVVTYRPFKLGDAAACSRLVFGNFKGMLGGSVHGKEARQIYSEQNLPKVAKERDYHVAEVRGEVVGVMGFLSYDAKVVEVSNLAVDTGIQGKGIGTLLVVLGMLGKIESGISRFIVYTNDRSRSIFVRFGFQKNDKLPASVIGEDSVPMEVEASALLRRKLEQTLEGIIE
jgi:N-acetylglutamate synthase-like GNAT family acetyltransferase